MSTSFDIFVVTYGVTNFLPKLVQHAIIFYEKKLNFHFVNYLFSGIAPSIHEPTGWKIVRKCWKFDKKNRVERGERCGCLLHGVIDLGIDNNELQPLVTSCFVAFIVCQYFSLFSWVKETSLVYLQLRRARLTCNYSFIFQFNLFFPNRKESSVRGKPVNQDPNGLRQPTDPSFSGYSAYSWDKVIQKLTDFKMTGNPDAMVPPRFLLSPAVADSGASRCQGFPKSNHVSNWCSLPQQMQQRSIWREGFHLVWGTFKPNAIFWAEILDPCFLSVLCISLADSGCCRAGGTNHVTCNVSATSTCCLTWRRKTWGMFPL